MTTKQVAALDVQSFGLLPELPFILDGLPKMTVVNLFGLPLAVPKGYKWIAFDSDGDIRAFNNKPRFNGNYFYLDNDCADCDSILLGDLTNYTCINISNKLSKSSLIKVKKLPKYYP